MEKQTDTKNRRIVVQYDGTTWSTFALEDMGITSRYAYKSTMIDSSGAVWILTTKESLKSMITRYDGTTWQTLDLSGTPLDSIYVTCLFTDSDGVVWAGTGTRGLFQYKNNTWSQVRFSEIEFLPGISTFNDFRLSSLIIDTDQSIWLGYGTNKETYISDNVWHTDTLPAMLIASIVDAQGTQWLTSNEGLWRRQPTSWEKISDEIFTSLYADRSNNIWLGMEMSGGVARYNNDQWTYYTGENSDFYSTCVAMTEAKDGTLWAATVDCFLTFDGNIWTIVNTNYPQELSGEGVSKKVELMVADSTGMFWLADKYTSQVFSFDGTTWTKYNIPDSIGIVQAQEISSIVTDRNSNVWMGTRMNESPNTSLIRVDSHTKEWDIFTPENSPLPYGSISCLAVDTSNTLWIGMNNYNKLVSYREGDLLVDVTEQAQAQTPSISLRSFPNPTSVQTTLRYSVPPSAGVVPVRIQLYNTLGMPVAILEESRKNPGEHTLDVDVTTLATGTYYYRLQIGSSAQTQQLVVVK